MKNGKSSGCKGGAAKTQRNERRLHKERERRSIQRLQRKKEVKGQRQGKDTREKEKKGGVQYSRTVRTAIRPSCEIPWLIPAPSKHLLQQRNPEQKKGKDTPSFPGANNPSTHSTWAVQLLPKYLDPATALSTI